MKKSFSKRGRSSFSRRKRGFSGRKSSRYIVVQRGGAYL